jgi:hypothetical protein
LWVIISYIFHVGGEYILFFIPYET